MSETATSQGEDAETHLETLLEAARELQQWEDEAVARLGASGILSFKRNSLRPDSLLHTILSAAQEVRVAREATAAAPAADSGQVVHTALEV